MTAEYYIVIATAISLTINGVVNIPSSQALYLGAGILYSSDNLLLAQIAVAGAAGNTIGNLILIMCVKRGLHFEFIRKNLEKHSDIIRKYVARVTLLHLYIGKLTPGLKVIVPYVVGIQNRPIIQTSVMLLITSLIWSFLLVYLGSHIGNLGEVHKYILFIAVLICFAHIAKKINRKYE